MKTRLVLILAIFTSILFISCKDHDAEVNYDFGKVKTPTEPFVGLLESRPQILVKSLEIPPYCWLVQKDIDYAEREFDVEFNNDAHRAYSTVHVDFRNWNAQPERYAKFYYNGIQLDDGKDLDSYWEQQTVIVRITLDPQMGDTNYRGTVLFSSSTTDSVNGIAIVEDALQCATWSISQKKSSPFWIWLAWLLTGILVLIILLVILALIVALLISLVTLLSSMFGGGGGSGKDQSKSKSKKQKYQKRKKKKEKRKVWLQTVQYNDLLLGVKVSEPQFVDEDKLDPYIWWYASDRRKAKRFARRFSRYIRRSYKKRHRTSFVVHRFLNSSEKYIWVNVPYRSHFRNMNIVEGRANNINMTDKCLYFPNTYVGRLHANNLLDELNKFIDNNY